MFLGQGSISLYKIDTLFPTMPEDFTASVGALLQRLPFGELQPHVLVIRRGLSGRTPLVSSATRNGGSMKETIPSVLVSTGLLVLVFALSAGHTSQVFAATAEPGDAVAVDDVVTLVRSFASGRGPCTTDLGVPTNRVFPDGSEEVFVVPAGKALVLTDLEGEITKKLSAAWPIGSVGHLTARLTGAVENQVVRARAQINADAVSAGIAAMELHLQSGVVADSGAAVCLSASVVYSTGVSSANVGTDVRLHGYLIDR